MAHKLAVVGLFGQPVLHVSVVPGCFVEPRQGPEELGWFATCCNNAVASQSVGFSANIVVLPSTQLFKAVWA